MACGRAAANLDLYFCSPRLVLDVFAAYAADSDFALVEGNRGLYDGFNESGEYSAAALARVLRSPVLLCVDCAKSTRTVAAVINGLTAFEDNLDFCGVVLNRVGSPRHESAVVKAITNYTSLKPLGSIPRLDENPLPERHMGLAAAVGHAREELELKLDNLAKIIKTGCDVDEILRLTQSERPQNAAKTEVLVSATLRPKIGYVKDKALWFYYRENLEALTDAGAELVRLSLFDGGETNEKAWEEIDGLYLGGGFPEDYAEEISRSPYLKKIASIANTNAPVYAECGGLMILCASLEIGDISWPMTRIFPATARWRSKPQGLGYVEAEVILKNPYFPLGKKIRAHEFHYSRCDWPNNAEPECALKLVRGDGVIKKKENLDGIIRNNLWASYAHIYAPASPEWAGNFVNLARSFKKSRIPNPKSRA